ncbi:MAG TPA: M23 family metallopeptidase [Xanthomonadaceae bacterium]
MKSLGVLLLGIVLGALLHREYVRWRPIDAAAEVPSAVAAPVAAPAAVSTDAAVVGIEPVAPAPGGSSTPVLPPPVVDTTQSGAAPSGSVPIPAPADSTLLIPVQGKRPADLSDTFTDSRSEGRSHEAIDIMADAGTPVLAVADGHVEKLFTSDRGGLTIYQFEPSGQYAYYYAHLQRYADGLRERQAIRKGEVIGYVGATGNADPTAPHLHFAIFLLGPERQWWKGTAINPYPLLARR